MQPLLDWPAVSKLPWRQRNAHIERALRTFLADAPACFVIDTMSLAKVLWRPNAEEKEKILAAKGAERPTAKLAQTLAKMAPYMGPLATHDGERIIRYGRQWRRWQWRGQGGHDVT